MYINKNIPRYRLLQLHQKTNQAAELDFLEARYAFVMANISTILDLQDQEIQEYLRACILSPLSGLFIQRLALSLAAEPSNRIARLLQLGCSYEPLNLERYLTYADWLINTDQRQQALNKINRVLQSHPEWTTRLQNFILINRLGRDEIAALLPAIPEAWHAAGTLMAQAGKWKLAEDYFLHSLDLLENRQQRQARPQYFSSLYSLYLQQKNEDRAVTVLRRAIKYFPDNARFHRLLGDYYLNHGIPYRAAEEYRQALLLNPDNHVLKQQLDRLLRKNSEAADSLKDAVKSNQR
jgi:tetratricopeptide (TPR) repeat protein